MKQDIKSLDPQQLKTQLVALGQQGFRATQIFSWLHDKRVNSFEEMTNLSIQTRLALQEHFYITQLAVADKLTSQLDNTRKYLLRLEDGNHIEAVLMQYKHGYSLCISTQVGCRMGCTFCASTRAGLVRNLTASEMLEEIYAIERESGQHVSSLVLMGIGEPLDNYENVLQFLKLLSIPEGKNLSLRHVSLSTCGLVDRIYDLMEHKLGVTLSISLHATDNATRSKIMPINQKYKIEELLKACKKYFEVTGRRVSFEYALISGVNDRSEDAQGLARLLRGMQCHVNLIPINAVSETQYQRSNWMKIETFRRDLEKQGINATIRRELGSDISAACGQLRLSKVRGEENANNR